MKHALLLLTLFLSLFLLCSCGEDGGKHVLRHKNTAVA